MFSSAEANSANYATAGISLAILLTRLAAGVWRRRPLDLAFYLVVFSIISVTARVTLNYYQLHLGTSNDARSDPDYFKTHSSSDVVSGSKAILASRVAITVTLWLQVCLLLLFYKRILDGIRWIRITIQLTWIVAGLSFLAVMLVTFLECRPLRKYWQTQPDPGKCVKAYKQLWSQCLCNIILDLMLLVISFPILFHRGRSWSQNIRVGSVFILGTFCLVVTIMRLTAVFGNGGSQATRTVWGAVQVIVATFVANAPTIYGDVRVANRRKSDIRHRRSSRPESWTRTGVDKESNVGDGEEDGGGTPGKEQTTDKGDLESMDEVQCTPTISETNPNVRG